MLAIGTFTDVLSARVVFAVLMISNAIGQIAPSTSAFSQASSAASELFEVLDRKSLLDPHSDAGAKPDHVLGDIAVRNVRFSYPSRPDITVLKNVSFDIPANKVTAFVGASGSGKSTLVSLLERWYEPSEGCLTLDGRNIDELNVGWLRNKIRLVQQEPVLFNDTIFNNVAQGLTGTSYEHADESTRRRLVADACRNANAAEFVESLTDGYDTNVGERGGLLSGGQKQRIAIARSIISNPPVLLLDEATSALDANSEKMVQQALDRVSRSRTTIVIAHKLATVMKADNIIVFGQGKVLEQGTHETLLQHQGPYASLVNAQSLRNKQSEKDTLPAFRNQDSASDVPLERQEVAEEAAIAAARDSGIRPDEESCMQPQSRNLIHILGTFLGENLNLWQMYLVCLMCSLIGGKSPTPLIKARKW
jgi:ATP-binding cassette subfamily B (MDR/TAP) protein 1